MKKQSILGLSFALAGGLVAGPVFAQDNDILSMTEADQARAFRDFWASFADSYYQVQLDGGPKIIAENGSNQKVCFKFKARPNEKRIDYYMQTLSEMSLGDRQVFLGSQELVGVNFTAKLSEIFGQSREFDLGKSRGKKTLMGFFDFTSKVLKRPSKIVLYLPGLREVVIRTNKKVTLRLPFIVSLDTKGKSLTEKELIHVPSELCSDWIAASLLTKKSTAQIETISMVSFLDRVELKLGPEDGYEPSELLIPPR